MEDENGNIMLEVTAAGKGTITFNYTHRPTRNENKDKVQNIKKLANNIKTSAIKNVIGNVADQSQKDTLVEYASAFDFKRPIGLEERISLPKKLHSIYGVNYSHTVENVQEEMWNEHQIMLKYPAKIECSESTLIGEFRNLWSVHNHLRPRFNYDPKIANMMMTMHILDNYMITHPNLCTLLQILLAVAPTTEPLEISHSQLAKLCYKYRNRLKAENIESLYILSALKEPVKMYFEGTCSFLEKK